MEQTRKQTKQLDTADYAVDAKKLNMEKAKVLYEKLNEFEALISQAKIAGEEWIETNKDVIDAINKNGLGYTKDIGGNKIPVKHFTYKGIHVCLDGTLQDVLDEINTPTYVKMHGKEEGVVERN